MENKNITEIEFYNQMLMISKLVLREQIVVLRDLVHFHKRDKERSDGDKCFTEPDNNILINMYDLELERRYCMWINTEEFVNTNTKKKIVRKNK